jgi:hypothetical protein
MRCLLLFGLLMAGAPVFAQCPAGIPSAGNPGCIPPDQSNSPYYQQNGAGTTQPQAVWADRWGAIAVDKGKQSVGIGVAEMMASERKAKASAIGDCRAKGGTQCKVVLAYYNQCGVLVAGDAGYTSMGSSTAEKAAKLGMEQCTKTGLRNCRVYYSACSFPEQVR